MCIRDRYYSANEVLKILDEVNRLESLIPEKGGMMKYYDTPFGQDSSNKSMILIRIEKFIETSPYLESIVNNPSVHFLLNQLFGESAVLMKEKINFKPPGAPPDLLHQDSQAGWDEYGSEFVSVLIAVEDSNISNACVEFGFSKNSLFKNITYFIKFRRVTSYNKFKKYFEAGGVIPIHCISIVISR